MNIRLGPEKVCFKISADELKTLLAGQPLRERIVLGGHGIGLSIHPVATDGAMSATYSADTLRLCLAPEKVRELADMGRSREGLTCDGNGIRVELLVDFRTQKRDPAKSPRGTSF